MLVDSQVDDLQRKLFNLTLDPLDVPATASSSAATPGAPAARALTPWASGSQARRCGAWSRSMATSSRTSPPSRTSSSSWGWYGLATDEAGMKETALIDKLADTSSRADEAAMAELAELVAADERLRPPHDRVAETAKAEAAIL
uniref:Uncharacterized protein n=1 Tax=Phenylobacterium glaciei TaxID=2803784 RepID=A0A974S9K0_9CAUL|nr:hypothetical protein JKL49_05070 [Phenylobacterium glaciei]